MKNFLYSKTMLYILATLLLLTFFLPDLIGPLPALSVGFLTIGASLFVYNKWSKTENTGNTPIGKKNLTDE